jgi:hypothetical protein
MYTDHHLLAHVTLWTHDCVRCTITVYISIIRCMLDRLYHVPLSTCPRSASLVDVATYTPERMYYELLCTSYIAVHVDHMYCIDGCHYYVYHSIVPHDGLASSTIKHLNIIARIKHTTYGYSFPHYLRSPTDRTDIHILLLLHYSLHGSIILLHYSLRSFIIPYYSLHSSFTTTSTIASC